MQSKPEFVGEGRKALVQGIIDQFDQLTNQYGESRSCWISLEAPSGWGKTRIAQEVYRNLSSRQEMRYWPETIVGSYDVEIHDVAGRRKRIFPNIDGFHREAGSLPEFFWWGLACDMRSSSDVTNNLKQDLDQLHRHAPYLEAAWSAQKALGLERYATVQAARKAFAALVDEGAATALIKTAELLGSAVPGLGLSVQMARFGIGVTKEKIDRRASLNRFGSLDENGEKLDYIDDTVMLLSRLATPGLPAIVFVEDLHKAPDELLQLLIALLGRNAPIMIISTTWPGEFESAPRLRELLGNTAINDRVQRVQYDQDVPTGYPKEASLGQLPKQALSELVYSLYPQAEPETVSRLVERYPNPLPLELVLTLRPQLKQYPNLALTADKVSQLPRKVKKLYNELWDELPEPVQCVLALVTLAMTDRAPIWLSPLVADSIRHLDTLENTNDLLTVLNEDTVPHGWSRVVESWLRRFGELDQFIIAKEALTDIYDEEDIEDFIESLTYQLADIDFEGEAENDPEMLHKAWLVISFKSHEKIKCDVILQATLYLVMYMTSIPLMLQNGLRLCDEILNFDKIKQNKSETSLYLWLEFHKSKILGELGNYGKSLEVLNRLHDFLQHNELKNDPRNLVFSNDLAVRLGQSGQIKASLNIYWDLVMDMGVHFGYRSVETMRVRNNYYNQMGKFGDYEVAAEKLYQLYLDRVRILGEDHIETLKTLHDYGLLWEQTKGIKDALDYMDALRSHVNEKLGENHFISLSTLHHVGVLLRKAGYIEDSIQILKNAVHKKTLHLGSHHPDTLCSESSLSGLCFLYMDPLAAEKNISIVIDKHVKIFGPEHSETLNCILNLANFYVFDQKYDHAIKHYLEVKESFLNLYPENQEVILTLRSNLSYCYKLAGYKKEGLAEASTLFDEMKSVFGENHESTLAIKSITDELLNM